MSILNRLFPCLKYIERDSGSDDIDSQEENIFDKMASASKRMEVLGDNYRPSEQTRDILYDVYENATMDGCFLSFDVDKNESLSIDEFDRLLKRLFKDKEGHAHYMDESKRKSIFDIFDKSGDELINKNEFSYCWESWIRKVCKYSNDINST